MNFRNKVRQYYQEALIFLVKDSYLRQSLRGHERVPSFIDNLAEEFPKVNLLRFRQGKKPVDEHQVKTIVYQMTEVFIHNVMAAADAAHESDIARIKKEQEAAEVAKLEKASQGIYVDEFEEMGLISDESRQENQSPEASGDSGQSEGPRIVLTDRT